MTQSKDKDQESVLLSVREDRGGGWRWERPTWSQVQQMEGNPPPGVGGESLVQYLR